MKWLHLGYHTQLAQPFEVLWRDHLRVHQAKASIAHAVPLFYLFKVIQQYVISFVTDRVNAHLHPALSASSI